MNGVGFEILARTPVPKLPLSYPPPPPTYGCDLYNNSPPPRATYGCDLYNNSPPPPRATYGCDLYNNSPTALLSLQITGC